MNPDQHTIDTVVRQALEEDIGHGDITTASIVGSEQRARGRLVFKESGVLAGLLVAQTAFRLIDPSLLVTGMAEDGDVIAPGQTVLEVEGCARSILVAERVALNFLQHMSGIASKTSRLTEAIRYYNAKLTDTRKTTPGLRVFEKYAVLVGGGRNHRFGLYDAVLIKQSHVELIGELKTAILAARRQAPHTVKIEVEVTSIEQIEQALEVKADILLLTGMSSAELEEAVEAVRGRALVEVPGGNTDESIVEIAKTGVDYIAVGALTQIFKKINMTLEITPIPT